MKISIISDTHGLLEDSVKKHLANSDEIWHAGDIGSMAIIDELEALAGKARIVFGNIDSHSIRQACSENQVFTINGLVVLITHIAGNPPGYNNRVRELIAHYKPDLLVCGHSHILKVTHDPKNKLLFINPGACGNHGFHKVKTLIQVEIQDGKPRNMKVIELGKRGKLEQDIKKG